MASTALLLHDVYRELCNTSPAPNSESTRAMVLLVQAVIQCWENCPEYSRAMKDAQSDCDFVTAAIDWLSERDRKAFQSLTYANLESHMSILRQHGVTDDDLLTLNALAKTGQSQELFERVSAILQKLQQPTLLIALGLVTFSRVPSTVARHIGVVPNQLPPLTISYIDGNGALAVIDLRNPNLAPLAYSQQIQKGHVVFASQDQLFAVGGVTDASSEPLIFNGAELVTSENQLVPPPYAFVVGTLYFRDWILIDLETGNVRVFHPDQSVLDARLEDFSAILSSTLSDGDIVLTPMSGESRVLRVIDVPTLDLEEQRKEEAFLSFLRRDSNHFVVATNSLACL